MARARKRLVWCPVAFSASTGRASRQKAIASLSTRWVRTSLLAGLMHPPKASQADIRVVEILQQSLCNSQMSSVLLGKHFTLLAQTQDPISLGSTN